MSGWAQIHPFLPQIMEGSAGNKLNYVKLLDDNPVMDQAEDPASQHMGIPPAPP